MAGERRYILADHAKADLVEIARYTRQKWGSLQQETYISGLYKLFDRIAEQPGLGRVRSPKRPNVRMRLYRNTHIVFYQPSPAGIEIARVLHVKQDSDAVFSET